MLKNSVVPRNCQYGIGREGTIITHEVLLEIRKKHFEQPFDFHAAWAEAESIFGGALIKEKFISQREEKKMKGSE